MAIALTPAAEAEEVHTLNLSDLQSVAEQLDREMAQKCSDLRSLLEAEQTIVNQVQTILDQCEARAKRIRRALNALEGEAPGRKPETQKPKATSGWKVSEEKIEQAYDAIVKAIGLNDGQPVTMTEARRVEGSGGHETYRQAIDVLRDRERIRVAGKTRGGGTLLALMPDADRTEDAAA